MKNQVLLTSEQLIELSSYLCDIADTLNLQLLAQNSFSLGENCTKWDLINARKLNDLIYNQNQKIAEKLEDISGILANNDNAIEIASYFQRFHKGA